MTVVISFRFQILVLVGSDKVVQERVPNEKEVYLHARVYLFRSGYQTKRRYSLRLHRFAAECVPHTKPVLRPRPKR